MRCCKLRLSHEHSSHVYDVGCLLDRYFRHARLYARSNVSASISISTSICVYICIRISNVDVDHGSCHTSIAAKRRQSPRGPCIPHSARPEGHKPHYTTSYSEPHSQTSEFCRSGRGRAPCMRALVKFSAWLQSGNDVGASAVWGSGGFPNKP